MSLGLQNGYKLLFGGSCGGQHHVVLVWRRRWRRGPRADWSGRAPSPARPPPRVTGPGSERGGPGRTNTARFSTGGPPLVPALGIC